MSTATGFDTDPTDHVQMLQRLLRDQYQEGSVLKELVQNADDAEATVAHLGWADGLAIDHPLLSGPAVFAANDGPFRDTHARAIKRIGTSSKTNELGAIGKFGLGLKSIFHLGEVLYYFASAGQEVADKVGAIIPWGPDRRPDWKEVPEHARELVAAKLAPLLAERGQWFVVWMPLRLDRHRDGGRRLTISPQTFDRYAGPTLTGADPVFPRWAVDQVAASLPMLRRVQTVSAWKVAGGAPTALLHLDATGQPRCPRPHADASADGEFKGTVRRSADGKAGGLSYAGVAKVPTGEEFERLSQSPFWPVVFQADADGREEARREKAPAHAAVCWERDVGEPTAAGVLRVRPAVFLPLADDAGGLAQDLPLNDHRGEYILLLHGGFIIDAGRRGFRLGRSVADAPDTATKLAEAWNGALARQATFPLIPSSLAALRDDGASADELRALTDALRRSVLFRDYRNAVCARGQWVYRWSDGGVKWEVGEVAAPLRELPDPGRDEQLPLRTFPAIGAVGNALLTFRGWPRLAARDHEPWSAATVAELLDGAADEPIADPTSRAAAYVNDFLDLCGHALTDAAVSAALVRLLRRVFARLSLVQVAAEQVAAVRRLIARLPSGFRVGLPFGNPQFGSNPELVWEAVRGLDVPPLIIPQVIDDGFDRPNRGNGVLREDELLRVLEAVSAVPPAQNPTGDPRFGVAVAAALACHSLPDRARALERCNRELFLVDELTPEGAVRTATLSAPELRRRHARRCVFQAADAGPAADFARALRGEPITLVTERTGDAVLCTRHVPRVDLAGVVGLLTRSETPTPAPAPSDRCPLLVWLMSQHAQPADGWRSTARLLLHGRAEHAADGNRLWAEAGETGTLWSRLGRGALDARGEGWRLIPAELADVAWGRAGAIRLERLNEETAAQLVEAADPEKLTVPITDDQAGQLIVAWRNRVPLLQKLPIHQRADSTGAPQPIHADCFWQDGELVPASLAGRVTLLKPSSDRLVREAQVPLASVWSAREVIATALAEVEDEPRRHWEAVIGALGRLQSIPDSLHKLLRDRPWLPLVNGKAIKPGNVLHLPAVASEVAAAVSRAGSEFVDPTALDPAVQNHTLGFARLTRDVFPPNRDALRYLAMLLGDDEAWHVGPILDRLNTRRALADFLDAFRGGAGVMRAHSLVHNVYQNYGEDECIDGLLPELCRALNRDRLLAVLRFLRAEDTRARRAVYLWYLRLLADLDGGQHFRELLDTDEPLFRSLSGNWKPGRDLCARGDNLAPEFLLDPDQRAEVEDRLPKTGPPATPGASVAAGPAPPQVGDVEAWQEKSAQRLREYFRPWVESHPELMPAVGGFLAALGEHEAIRRLADTWLRPNSSVAQVRAAFRLNLGGASPDEEFKKKVIFVQVAGEAGQAVEVVALNGCALPARLSAEPEDLLLQYYPIPLAYIDMSPSRRWLRLRAWRPEGDVVRAQRLLQKATEAVLEALFNQRAGHDISRLFQVLNRQDLRDVRIAQMMVLDSAPANLRKLDLQLHPTLYALLQQATDADRRRLEAEDARSQGLPTADPAEVERVQQAARDALRDAFVTAETQRLILDAVRRTIAGHYQYRADGVLFELFQNADDAAGELTAFGPALPASRRCVVEWAAGVLRFLHAGRPVNQDTRGTETVRDRGFDQDLQKMLELKWSDKPADGGGVGFAPTGKFGLGFKSTYLVADEPRVRSGPLGFRVLGGMYPAHLPTEPVDDRDRLADLFGRLFGEPFDAVQGTVIELVGAKPAEAAAAVERFRNLLPYLLAFAQYVRHCEVVVGEGKRTVAWNPEDVPGAPGVTVGRLDAAGVSRGLRLDLGPRAALLLGLDAEGVGRDTNGGSAEPVLPDDVPTLWVTAPTQECEGVGFALNAPFVLDTGRAQLTRNPEDNEPLARQLGLELGARLVGLFDAAVRDWSAVRDRLQLRADATPERFWRSVWAVLARRFAQQVRGNDRQAHQVLRAAVWEGPLRGAARLYVDRAAIPSGLDAPGVRPLVRIGEITGLVAGCLDARAEVLQAVVGWEEFRTVCDATQVVSASRTWAVLDQLCRAHLPTAAVRITLAILFQRRFDPEAARRPVTPEESARWGRVITPEGLRAWAEAGFSDEVDALRAALAKARFRAADGLDAPVHELLLADHPEDGHEDEEMRAEFAPPDSVLAPEYTGEDAVRFFLACRTGGAVGRPEILAEWARTSTAARRCAFLVYVLRASTGPVLARWLRENRGAGDWWNDDTAFAASVGGLSPSDQIQLRALLRAEGGSVAGNTIQNELVRPPARQVLERIADWWQTNRKAQLESYLGKVYPPFLRDELTAVRVLPLAWVRLEDDPALRARWLGLFTLGMMHTLGWGGRTDGQHREFLQLCHDRGWLDTFAAPASSADDWLGVIDEYAPTAAGDPKYYFWMRRLFVGIRQVARWLPQYVAAFAEMRSDGCTLGAVLRTREAAQFQGGGVDAPSLAAVLGTGACFMVRELARGILLPPAQRHVRQWCYAPVASVRRLLTALGCGGHDQQPDRWRGAPVIYDFLREHLDDPTFGRDFDIPLWLVSRDPNLWTELVREEYVDATDIDDLE